MVGLPSILWITPSRLISCKRFRTKSRFCRSFRVVERCGVTSCRNFRSGAIANRSGKSFWRPIPTLKGSFHQPRSKVAQLPEAWVVRSGTWRRPERAVQRTAPNRPLRTEAVIRIGVSRPPPAAPAPTWAGRTALSGTKSFRSDLQKALPQPEPDGTARWLTSPFLVCPLLLQGGRRPTVRSFGDESLVQATSLFTVLAHALLGVRLHRLRSARRRHAHRGE